MRRTKAAATALGVSLLLAGCGSATTSVAGPSGSTSTPRPAPTVNAGPTAPSAEISDLRARMLAVAGVLQAEDLPTHTFEADEYEPGATENHALYECMNSPTPHYLINHPGATFTKGAQVIGSTVDVLTTAAGALKDLHALGTLLGQYCYGKDLKEYLQSEGDNPSDVSVTAAPITVRGADEAMQVRVSFSANGKNGGRVRGHMRGILAVVGGAQVGVLSMTADGTTPALAPVRRLTERAVARVRAAAAAPESDDDPAVANLGSTGPALGV